MVEKGIIGIAIYSAMQTDRAEIELNIYVPRTDSVIQIIEKGEIRTLKKKYPRNAERHAYYVKKMEGKNCTVEIENGTNTFLGLYE